MDALRPPVRSSISGWMVRWCPIRFVFVNFLLNCNFSLFSPDRSMVDDTSTIADIQHDLSFTLQNYMLSDNFPAHRPRVTFHVSYHWFIGIPWNSLAYIELEIIGFLANYRTSDDSKIPECRHCPFNKQANNGSAKCSRELFARPKNWTKFWIEINCRTFPQSVHRLGCSGTPDRDEEPITDLIKSLINLE